MFYAKANGRHCVCVPCSWSRGFSWRLRSSSRLWLVITEQLQFIQSNRLGFEKEHLVVIPVREDKVQKNFEAVQHSLAASPGIVSITALSNFAW